MLLSLPQTKVRADKSNETACRLASGTHELGLQALTCFYMFFPGIALAQMSRMMCIIVAPCHRNGKQTSFCTSLTQTLPSWQPLRGRLLMSCWQIFPCAPQSMRWTGSPLYGGLQVAWLCRFHLGMCLKGLLLS